MFVVSGHRLISRKAQLCFSERCATNVAVGSMFLMEKQFLGIFRFCETNDVVCCFWRVWLILLSHHERVGATSRSESLKSGGGDVQHERSASACLLARGLTKQVLIWTCADVVCWSLQLDMGEKNLDSTHFVAGRSRCHLHLDREHNTARCAATTASPPSSRDTSASASEFLLDSEPIVLESGPNSDSLQSWNCRGEAKRIQDCTQGRGDLCPVPRETTNYKGSNNRKRSCL